MVIDKESLLETYKEVTKSVEPDDESIDKVTPTNLYTLTTSCGSVREKYLETFVDSLNKNSTPSRIKKTLGGLFRLILDDNDSSGASLKDLMIEKYLGPEESGYNIDRIKEIATRLQTLKEEKASVIINPKTDFRRKLFKPDIVTTANIMIKTGDYMELDVLSPAKEETEYKSPSLSEMAMLLRLLMFRLKEPVKTRYMRFRVCYAGGALAKDKTWEMDAKMLTEKPSITIRRILSVYASKQYWSPTDCTSCIHKSFCPLLTEEVANRLKGLDI